MARRSTRAAGRRPNAKRDLQRHLANALAELDGNSPLHDRSVHEARKELKRARSTLRLLRDAIGDAAYRRSNRRLRDAARPLSPVRDAKVLLDAVVRLRVGSKDPSRRAEWSALERQLRSSRIRAQSKLDRSADLRRVKRMVESVLADSRRWPAATRASACSGVARIYRKGRKAFAHADATRGEEALHESRKQTKYLTRALEVIAPARRAVAKRGHRADSIADALGDDHDLAMVRRKLMRRRLRSASVRDALLADVERRRTKLQRKASKAGRVLYQHKAKAFMDSLEL